MLDLDMTKGEKMTDPQQYELVFEMDGDEANVYIEDYTEEEADAE
jgi:plasmid maintenance system killer protein